MEFLKDIRKSTFPRQHIKHLEDTSILDISNLFVRFDSRLALDDVSFQLHHGERVAVVGPNGAGKSTLFKAIAGVLKPISGEIKVYGHGPGGHICIAYLSQRSQVDWSFPVTVSDVVMMGRIGKLGLLRWPKHRDWEIVRQALMDVGLEELANRQIGELSGGQQQRMFIARALAQEAELMLMDEPLTGLDIGSQESIFTFLDDLQGRGVTVMVATHDLDLAARRFDRVMLLNQRMIGFGVPEQVFTPEQLMSAYGGHIHLVETDDQLLVVADTCCDEGENT
ncbi:MAG TPA: metal ABC transporter ATP-binding protein [Anaerolineales bacterium]|jgi:manganese/iron transport system ATP-binding protein|nr:metal ABC transporter ATP-binding protein [Anaerolineales bacterium]